VGYSTSIDTPENQKFVADFTAANKAAPDLYGADSYGVLFFYKAAVEKAKSTETDKVRTAMRGLQWNTPQGRQDAARRRPPGDAGHVRGEGQRRQVRDRRARSRRPPPSARHLHQVLRQA
jgi:hypothetical protein